VAENVDDAFGRIQLTHRRISIIRRTVEVGEHHVRNPVCVVVLETAPLDLCPHSRIVHVAIRLVGLRHVGEGDVRRVAVNPCLAEEFRRPRNVGLKQVRVLRHFNGAEDETVAVVFEALNPELRRSQILRARRRIPDEFVGSLHHVHKRQVACVLQVQVSQRRPIAEVQALLASDEQASLFIESPALAIAPELLATDPVTTVTGKTVGPYRLDARLGAGGMGKVYLAHDIRLGRKVALKLLDPRLLDDTEQRTRFLREARLASLLDHPNICTIHEVGEAGGRLFIAMKYVEGQTLKQVINGKPLSLDCLLSVSLQVADAITAAHAQGVIHRDIKAGNIIVTPRGQARVLDFGLAKLLEQAGEDEPDLTMTGAVMGTPSSMSPEQARGDRTDHRSDIFSFGVVMYEMATGQRPFKAGSTKPSPSSEPDSDLIRFRS
jgi:tRNA A-37 threonylcarbamoyl transferase component Bud32